MNSVTKLGGGEPDTVAKAVAEQVSRLLNVCGNKKEIAEFVEAMGNEHRTLQQSFSRLALAWFEKLASLEPNQYDLRNEASVKLAKKLIALFGNVYLPLI